MKQQERVTKSASKDEVKDDAFEIITEVSTRKESHHTTERASTRDYEYSQTAIGVDDED